MKRRRLAVRSFVDKKILDWIDALTERNLYLKVVKINNLIFIDELYAERNWDLTRLVFFFFNYN